MNISLFTTNIINTVRKTDFKKQASNPINFKGLNQDTFEKQSKEKKKLSIQEQASLVFAMDEKIQSLKAELSSYSKAGSRNYKREEELRTLIQDAKKERGNLIAELDPNIAFLHNEDLSWGERKKILASHDEIENLFNIETAQKDGSYRNLWYSGKYFITDKTNIGIYVDSSYEPNIENYRLMTQDGLKSQQEICSQYGFDIVELNRYIKDGVMTPIYLRNLETGELEATNIFDSKDEESFQKGIERHQAIQAKLPKKSKYMDRGYQSAQYLSKLGYGSEEKLFDAVRFKNLAGKIIKANTPEGEKDVAYILTAHPKTIGQLQYERTQNKNIMSVQDFCKHAKISIGEYEDALLGGEIVNIPVYVTDSDKNRMLFDISNPTNRRFCRLKKFEREISKLKANESRKEKASFRMGLVWALCPKTSGVVGDLIRINPKIAEILKKEDEIKELENKKSDSEEEIPSLTYEERIELKKFYKAIWNSAKTEEFSQAHQKAKEAIVQFRRGGLEAIEDERARRYFEENIENAQEVL